MMSLSSANGWIGHMSMRGQMPEGVCAAEWISLSSEHARFFEGRFSGSLLGVSRVCEDGVEPSGVQGVVMSRNMPRLPRLLLSDWRERPDPDLFTVRSTEAVMSAAAAQERLRSSPWRPLGRSAGVQQRRVSL